MTCMVLRCLLNPYWYSLLLYTAICPVTLEQKQLVHHRMVCQALKQQKSRSPPALRKLLLVKDGVYSRQQLPKNEFNRLLDGVEIPSGPAALPILSFATASYICTMTN